MNHTPASRDEACNGVRGYGLNEQVTHEQYILANGNKDYKAYLQLSVQAYSTGPSQSVSTGHIWGVYKWKG